MAHVLQPRVSRKEPLLFLASPCAGCSRLCGVPGPKMAPVMDSGTWPSWLSGVLGAASTNKALNVRWWAQLSETFGPCAPQTFSLPKSSRFVFVSIYYTAFKNDRTSHKAWKLRYVKKKKDETTKRTEMRKWENWRQHPLGDATADDAVPFFLAFGIGTIHKSLCPIYIILFCLVFICSFLFSSVFMLLLIFFGTFICSHIFQVHERIFLPAHLLGQLATKEMLHCHSCHICFLVVFAPTYYLYIISPLTDNLSIIRQQLAERQ